LAEMSAKNINIFPRVLCPLAVLLPFLLSGEPAPAFFKQEGKLGTRAASSREEDNRRYFTDLPVVTQEGKEVRFYSDLLKNRVVLINFFYTNCPTAPPEMEKLATARKMLGERIGKDIFLISISVDPERDTVKAIREYAAKYETQAGWIFLTGKKENLGVINRKLGNTNPNPESHILLFLLGNLKTGHWMKMNQFAPVSSVVEGLRVLAEDSGNAPSVTK
jgi:protein SCO1/2